jgi:hypothetical protein
MDEFVRESCLEDRQPAPGILCGAQVPAALMLAPIQEAIDGISYLGRFNGFGRG